MAKDINSPNAATPMAAAASMFFPSLQSEAGFNPKKDITSVDQVGFVDLQKAFVTGVIPGDLSVKEDSYNGVDEPASLVGRPRDVFEAIRNAQNVQKSAAAAEAAAASSADTE